MMPGDAEWYNSEPVRSLVDGIQAMANGCSLYAFNKAIKRVSLTPDFGLTIGIAPGQKFIIHTASGPVEVRTEYD